MFAINKIYKDIKKKNPLLYKFLKENKALKKFAINFRHSFRYYKKYEGESIENAFNWGRSFEGFYYWEMLSGRFFLKKREIIEKSKLEY